MPGPAAIASVHAIQQETVEQLREDARLIPEQFRPYWDNYVKRDVGRCVTTMSFLPEPGENSRVLEVGSFPGVMSILLKRHGYDLACVDLDPGRMSKLVEEYEIPVTRTDIETEPLPYPDESFDHVLFAEVLEHLRINPIGAVREVHRVLKLGGTMVLSVPNIKPIQRLQFLFGKDYQGDIVAEFEKLERLGHMGHLRLYSRLEVMSILDSVGFSEVSYARAGRRANPGLVYRLIFRGLAALTKLVPRAEFDASPDAHFSHLFAVARK